MAAPGPLGPISWAARAHALGVAKTGGVVPATGGDDAEDEITLMMREERRADAADRLRDQIEEAADRREIRKLERQQRLIRLRAQASGEVPMFGGRGARGGGDDDGIDELRRELLADRNDLKGQIEKLQGTLTTSNENALKAQIDRLSTQIEGIRSAPGVDPMQALTNAFDMAAKIRDRVDSLMPPPAPPPMDLGLTHEQSLARERAGLEHDIYRLEREEALETVKLKRDQIRADRDKAQERLNGIIGGVRDVAQAFAGAAAPMLANFLPGAIGGGAGAPAVANGAVAPAVPAGIPFACPACHQADTVPFGTGVTKCRHCGTGPIFIQDRSLPAPPGMVTSL